MKESNIKSQRDSKEESKSKGSEKTEVVPSIVESFKTEFEKKYYWGLGSGILSLVIAIILIHFLRGTMPWWEAFLYPLLFYFIASQVLSGFGFITGYIPIAQDIINWLTKTSKKKAYSEKEVEKWEKTIQKLEVEEKKELEKISKNEAKLTGKYKEIDEKKAIGKWDDKKIKKELEKCEKEKVKITKEKEKVKKEITDEKLKLKEIQKEYRGKVSEKILTVQEELDPDRFKLIMLIPLYFMTILGVILTIIGLINPIITWAQGSTTNEIGALLTIDKINEIYKGIMATIGIISIHIIPAIRVLRNPSKEFIVKYKEEMVRKWIFFKKPKNDTRSVLNRQFEDLRKYYWTIKQKIRKTLFIPIGLSMVVAGPIGGLSVVLGINTGILRKKMRRYELIIQIIIAGALIALVVPTYFSFWATFLKNIHPIIPILSKLIYISMLILSFVLFTRSPLVSSEENSK